MKLLRKHRAALQTLEDRLTDTLTSIESSLPHKRSAVKQMAVAATWIAAGVGIVALGLAAGRELRLRYKFKRRTPYDLYSHSGDETPDVDFGVGV